MALCGQTCSCCKGNWCRWKLDPWCREPTVHSTGYEATENTAEHSADRQTMRMESGTSLKVTF